jgi:putative transposase
VDEHQGTFGVEPILRTIGEKTSTYYDRRARRQAPSAHAARDVELLARIRTIHAESGGVYGSPRVHAMLRREGQCVSRKRVERLMREHEIQGVCPARKVRTTIPNPADARPEDLVKRNFTADGPNRLWVTDLTLIETGQGPLWLSSIRDAFSRRIVAWHTAPRPDAELVCTALEYALASRDYERGALIHHADHGSQYTSIKLTSRLLKAGIKASMGTVGDSYDNALAENFWSVLKTECVRRTTFPTRADAELALFNYIDGFYNTRRIQKNLGYLSPDEYEAAHQAQHQVRPAHGQPPAAPPSPGRPPRPEHAAPPTRPAGTAKRVKAERANPQQP